MFVTISHEGHPAVVMMSFEEFEGWQETLEIMSDSSFMKDIREGMKDGAIIPLDELDDKRHTPSNVHSR